MMKPEPLIYTRTKYIDYRVVVAPQSLKFSNRWELILNHLRLVMADDGDYGPLQGRRWHVMSVDGHVLVGIATYEFARSDEEKRPIRGYYGALLPIESISFPTDAFFNSLDRLFVEPIFTEVTPTSTTGNPKWCVIENVHEIDDSLNEYTLANEETYDFNLSENNTRFFNNVDLDKILAAAFKVATESAKGNKFFEFVYGLNKRVHATEGCFMNAVCYETNSLLSTTDKFSTLSATQNKHKVGRMASKMEEHSVEDEREVLIAERFEREKRGASLRSFAQIDSIKRSPKTTVTASFSASGTTDEIDYAIGIREARKKRQHTTGTRSYDGGNTQEPTGGDTAIIQDITVTTYNKGLTSYSSGDYQTAVKWFREAADQGNVDAICKLGECYFKGRGVQRNRKKGLSLLREAADKGSLLAIDMLKAIKRFFFVLVIAVTLGVSLSLVIMPKIISCLRNLESGR